MKSAETREEPPKKSKLQDDYMNNIFNPQNPVATIRNLTGLGNKEFVASFIDKVNMMVDGGELIQAAIQFKQNAMLKYYIEKGAKVDMPPDNVSKLYTESAKNSEYRKSPFIIQAACAGDLDCFKTLMACGCKITDTGFIGFSRKRKNQVISNAIGAAAFNGSPQLLSYLMGKLSQVSINHSTSEKQDFTAKGQFNKEYSGYTPLMLAVAGGGQNIECVKILVQNKADTTFLDPVGNTLLHIAVLNNNVDALEYLIKNDMRINIFERNLKGETPLSIAQERKVERAIKFLEQVQLHQGDQTREKSEQLLNDLLMEELKEESKKLKKKDKKKRQKIRQLAEKEGVSYEAMEAKLKEEKEENEKLEKQRKKDEEDREKREAEVEKQRIEDRQRQIEEEERKRVKQVKFVEPEIKKEQPKQQEKENTHIASQATQFAHLKVKKPDQQQVKVEPKQAVESEKSQQAEEKKVKASQETDAAQQLNRKQRKMQQRIKDQEYKKRYEPVQPQKEEKESDAEAADQEDDESESSGEEGLVWGLESDMKLKTLANKKARRRLRKKLQKQKDEEELNKDKLKKLHEEQEAARIKKEQEEEQKAREEEEERKKKYEYFKPTQAPVYRVKQKDAIETKSSPHEEQKLYRPKAKQQIQEEETKTGETQGSYSQKKFSEDTQKVRHVQYQPKKKEIKVVEDNIGSNEAGSEGNQVQEQQQKQTIARPQEQSSQNHLKQPDAPQQQEKANASGTERPNGVKTPPSSPLPKHLENPANNLQQFNTSGFTLYPSTQTGGDMVHQHLQQLQSIILSKDQEIQFILAKCEKLEHELKTQSMLKAQTHGEDKDLRSQINHSNEQLLKEKALNKVLNSQLLDLEKLLKEEQAKRKVAEDKLFNVVYQRQQQNQSAPATTQNQENDLFELANDELRKKEKQLRESKKRQEIYEGHNLEKKTKPELQQAQRQLSDALKIINQLLEGGKNNH